MELQINQFWISEMHREVVFFWKFQKIIFHSPLDIFGNINWNRVSCSTQLTLVFSSVVSSLTYVKFANPLSALENAELWSSSWAVPSFYMNVSITCLNNQTAMSIKKGTIQISSVCCCCCCCFLNKQSPFKKKTFIISVKYQKITFL